MARGFWQRPENVALLKSVYPSATKAELAKAFPDKSMNAIYRAAAKFGLHRSKVVAHGANRRIRDPLIAFLRDRRIQLGITQKELAIKLGFNTQTVHRYEVEQALPSYFFLRAWLMGLGVTLLPRATREPLVQKSAEVVTQRMNALVRRMQETAHSDMLRWKREQNRRQNDAS